MDSPVRTSPDSQDQAGSSRPAAPSHIRLGKRRIPVPRTKPKRIGLALFLIVMGTIPIIPPGATSIPIGFTLLSMDFPRLRRPRRRMVVWGGRRLQGVMRLRAVRRLFGSGGPAPTL